MRVFVKVVDKGSLTSAANVLSLSPAMISNHLQALENHLEAVLIHRTTRKQSLTDFGQQYYDHCVEILSMIADAQAAAKGNTGEPSGKLRITAPVSLGSEALIPAIKTFNEQYPDIDIELLLTDHSIDLIEDDIDIAIRIGKLPDSSLISRRLCSYDMAVCASPAYLKRYGLPQTPQELSEHNCIQFNASADSPWVFQKQVKRTAVQVKGNLRVNNGRALCKAACEGMGIIMQPRILVKHQIQNGELIELFTNYSLPSREIHVVYLRDRHIPSKIRCLIDFLVAHFSI